MRIYACLLTETINLWHREILWSLRDMGHQVFMPEKVGLNESWYRIGAGCWSYKHRDELSRKLLADVKQVHDREHGVDLVLLYLFPFQFNPRVFKEIEALGIPTVLLFCDNLTDYSVAQEIAGYFTLTWVPELEAVERYRRLKRNFIYLPLGVNPNFNKPVGLDEKREMVCMASKTPYRRWLLGSLISRGLPIEVYGNHWHEGSVYYKYDDPTQKPIFKKLSLLEDGANFAEKKRKALYKFLRYGFRPKIMTHKLERLGEEFEPLFKNPAWGHPVSPERMVELFSESKVSLGINHYIDPSYTDIFNRTFSKLRDFEAPMSGACYLTQYTEELDDFYPQEEIIMSYRSLDDLCGKAALLLKDKGLRDSMRTRARAFCLENHTWEHRFRTLFEKLGLKNKAK